MKILVTGGAGFLGSNLCADLIDRGETVFCLDNLSTGSARNIAPLFGNERFHFIEENVIRPQNLAIDQIYNFASPAAPADYQRDPRGTLGANMKGTETLLKLAEKTGATMLQVSTIRVMEENISEKHRPYIEGKQYAEWRCLGYHEENRAKVKIARLNNIYGPKMSLTDSRVVPQFVMKALRDEPLMIWGGGGQRDSFCYVDDLIEGLTKYMASDIFPGPVEFGYPESISIYDLAFLTIQSLGSLSRIVMNGTSAMLKDRVPDISEARLKLGWEPKIPLDMGLMRLADYYSEIMG